MNLTAMFHTTHGGIHQQMKQDCTGPGGWVQPNFRALRGRWEALVLFGPQDELEWPAYRCLFCCSFFLIGFLRLNSYVFQCSFFIFGKKFFFKCCFLGKLTYNMSQNLWLWGSRCVVVYVIFVSCWFIHYYRWWLCPHSPLSVLPSHPYSLCACYPVALPVLGTSRKCNTTPVSLCLPYLMWFSVFRFICIAVNAMILSLDVAEWSSVL